MNPIIDDFNANFDRGASWAQTGPKPLTVSLGILTWACFGYTVVSLVKKAANR